MAIYSITCIILIMHCIFGQPVRDGLETLRGELLTRANKKIPPYQEISKTVDVNITFPLSSIIELHSSQMFSVAGSLAMSWQDPRMIWNPVNYSDHTFVELGEDEVWTPKFTLANGAESLDPIESNVPLVLLYTGVYQWSFDAIFRTRCKMDFQQYPFDSQTCKLIFAPISGYVINTVPVEPDSIAVNGSGDNGEWELLNVTSEIAPYERKGMTKKYTITLKRHYAYYLLNMIAPMLLMSVLTPVVFLIPARSGEKMGYLMSVFLSHAMFLNIIHDDIPPSSNQISNIAMFLAAVEAQGFLAVLASIMVIAVHHRKEKSDEQEVRKMSMSKDTDQTKKKRRCRCCANFSCERFLDGVFFVFSCAIASAGLLTFKFN